MAENKDKCHNGRKYRKQRNEPPGSKQRQDPEEQALLSNRKDWHDSEADGSIRDSSDLDDIEHSNHAQPINTTQQEIDSIYKWDHQNQQDDNQNLKNKAHNYKEIIQNGQQLITQGGVGGLDGQKQQPEYQVNLLYLIMLTLTLCLSSMQFSLALGGTCQVAPALRYQQNWGNDRGRIDFYITVLGTASIFGISAGSLFGGDYVQSLGPNKTIIVFNAFGLVGSILSIQSSFKIMCLGRFLFGITSGVLLCATSRVLEDTIPARLLDSGFGTSTNILMNVFGFILLLMSIGMPDKQELLETTTWWRAIFGLQIPFQVLVIFLHLFIFKEETIKFCLHLGDKEQAIRAITKIYSMESPEVHEQIYEAQSAAFIMQLRENSNRHDSVWTMLTDAKFRKSTWMAIWVAVANIICGICLVNGFAMMIFEKLNLNNSLGKYNKFTTKQDCYCVGFANIIGAMASYYTISMFSRRTIFIGGHLLMGMILCLSGYLMSLKQPDLVLYSLCSFVAVYQSTQGSCLFIYVAEIVVNEIAMGLALFSLMLAQTIHSMCSTYMINCKYGLDVILYAFGIFQLVPALYFTLCMRETQGLSAQDKKKLYVPVEMQQIGQKGQAKSEGLQQDQADNNKQDAFYGDDEKLKE